MRFRRYLFPFLFALLMCCFAGTPSLAASRTSAAVPKTSSYSDASKQNSVFAQTNAYRASRDLKPLRRSAILDAAASVRAKEIAVKFSHTRPNGASWTSVSPLAYGENIAKGYTTADKVMLAWMNSSGHRANILRPGFGSIGIASVKIGNSWYWVQLFGK